MKKREKKDIICDMCGRKIEKNPIVIRPEYNCSKKRVYCSKRCKKSGWLWHKLYPHCAWCRHEIENFDIENVIKVEHKSNVYIYCSEEHRDKHVAMLDHKAKKMAATKKWREEKKKSDEERKKYRSNMMPYEVSDAVEYCHDRRAKNETCSIYYKWPVFARCIDCKLYREIYHKRRIKIES